eukprot:2364554-Rhodomonas_salina.1
MSVNVTVRASVEEVGVSMPFLVKFIETRSPRGLRGEIKQNHVVVDGMNLITGCGLGCSTRPIP